MTPLLVLAAAMLLHGGGPQPPAANPTEMKTVAKGLHSAVDDGRQITARTPDEWTKVWRLHDFDRPAPKVDFVREMVVGVFMGSRPTGGFSVEIVGTRQEGGALIVQYRESMPGPGSMTAQVLTSPFHLVSVPRLDGDVKFERLK
jgi:hypothetical protein